MNQQTPIKDEGKAVEIGLGSNYAKQLGLAGVTEFYFSNTTSLLDSSGDANQTKQGEKNGKKKKKNKKKKKK